MNATRVQYILKQVESNRSSEKSVSTKGMPLDTLRALDIGCGGGLLSESLSRLGASVTGIDPSEDLVQAAKLHADLDARTRKIDYRGGMTAEELADQPSAAGTFDIVCLLEVIEHAIDVESLLKASINLVKPGGNLFVSTMSPTVKSYLLTIIGAEYIMGYLPVGTHDWNQYYSPSQVREIVSRHGMVEQNSSGMGLGRLPLCGSWDWKLDENDTDVNWIASYRKVENT